METWRWTELLQMLGMTTIGRHNRVVSQAHGEVRHRLVDVFLWQLFPDGLQLQVVLGSGWSFYFSSMALQTC